MATTTLPLPPRSTANPAPVRPARSVRRTSTIDVSWPDGDAGDRLFIGRARDFLTPADGASGRQLDAAEYRARLGEDKTIHAIEAEPAPSALSSLVGVRGGNHLRLFIKETMPELVDQGMPLYLVLDDISGSALVSAFAWSQWHDDWAEKFRDRIGGDQFEQLMQQRVNICWGLQAGNSGVSASAASANVAEADAGELRNPADPEGWHAFPEKDGPGFRRARRIDVAMDEVAGLIRIDSSFQDSANRRDGGRVAIHEYNLRATVDARNLELLELSAEPRILPFWECPGAVANTQRLIGSNLAQIRETVLERLRGPAGCTHLNDALRALAEVPKLAGYLKD